jgi:AcrR family transcriptional regulator
VPKDTQPTATTDRAQLQLPERVTVAVAELATAAREGLLALAVGTGLQVLEIMLAEDVARLVGAKGRHIPERSAVRHGSEPGQVTLGGRRMRVRRPRVRTADGTREVVVPTYQAFAATDLLDQLAVERMLAKLSTRRYQAGLEPVGTQVEQAATGTSRSAVSRRFVARTEHALAELLAQDLSGLDLVALMVDGIRVAEHCCVVALGITIDGTKIPLALAEGATENASQELGVVPMALYKHVANKEELVDGMVDLVFGEVAFATGGGDWKAAMRQRAISMRQALLRHRWAVGLMEARVRPGPADLRHHNAVLACLREAGFSFQTAVHTYSALDSYIYGFALQEKTFPFTTPQESGEAVETMLAMQPPSVAEEYPYLVEVAVELGKSGYDYAVEFQVGLDLLLDSIDQLRPQWRSAAS